jgi:FMN-dependent NADH-azoreductase
LTDHHPYIYTDEYEIINNQERHIMTNILRIDSSARTTGSYGRTLADQLIQKLQNKQGGASVVTRDVAQDSIAHVNAAWLAANYTPAPDRTPEQKTALAQSNVLIEEVQSADVLVIGCPIYNFSVPASLKAWIDQICRAGVTFSYSAEGPVGLLKGKTAYVVITSGGTVMDSTHDFATGYMRQVLGFIGITDVTVIASDGLMIDEAAATARAKAGIEAV